jgi:hypothetical protein
MAMAESQGMGNAAKTPAKPMPSLPGGQPQQGGSPPPLNNFTGTPGMAAPDPVEDALHARHPSPAPALTRPEQKEQHRWLMRSHGRPSFPRHPSTEAAAPTEAPAPDPFEKRYNDLRSEFDRKNALIDRATQGDIEAIRALGFDYDEPEDPTPEYVEDDPYAAEARRVREETG